MLLLFLPALFLLRRQNGVQRITLLPRPEFHHALILDVLDQALQNLPTQVRTGHLAPPEEDGRFDLISLAQEAQHMILLRHVVVVVDVDAEFHFFNDDLFLVLFGLALFLFLLVQEFPVIHDAANRGLSGGRDFNQVQVLFAGHFQRFVGRQDPDLVAFVIDHANFARTNPIVGADKALIDTILRTLPAESGVEIIAWGYDGA